MSIIREKDKLSEERGGLVMAMTKQEANAKIKETYILGGSLDEHEYEIENKVDHREIIGVYGNWDKAMRANAITSRKLREREKFMLYATLKERGQQYGPEALRPKNVHPEEFKHRIVKSFKTIKALKDIIGNWNEDKVMYELHMAMITGETINSLKETDNELHEKVLEFFNDIDNALDNYNKRFGVPTINKEEFLGNSVEETDEKLTLVESDKVPQPQSLQPVSQEKQIAVAEQTNGGETDDLINMMIKLNYIDDQEEAQAIVRANRMRKEEVGAFLLGELAAAQTTGEKVTDETIKAKNLSVYFAIKAHYGNLEGAVQEITRALFSQAL